MLVFSTMPQLCDLSVTIITLNEEKHIGAAIESVSGLAQEVIVVDSGSSDQTTQIAREKGARVIQNPWKGYGQQKNFAQSLAQSSWVLNIDADELVSPELAEEIRVALGKSSNPYEGFSIPRKTYFGSRWVRHGGWYPNYVTRLARRNLARWSEPAIHESLVVDGSIQALVHPLLHYSFDGVVSQVQTNLRYAQEGALQFLSQGGRPTVWRLIFRPLGKFLESYVLKRGFLDGLPGFFIAVNAAHSMFLKYAFAREHEAAGSRQ